MSQSLVYNINWNQYGNIIGNATSFVDTPKAPATIMLNLSHLKTNISPKQIGTSLVLTTVLSISGSLTFIHSFPTFADPINTDYSSKKVEIKPVVIPQNQLPQPLQRAVIFREISSGGITGATYQTILLNDGTLNRIRIGDTNDSERSVRKVSVEQLKQFKKLLQKHSIAKFNNLSYPAPRGAADYITYTLTSKEGTFQYNDISQNGLPNKLQSIVFAWKQIKTNAKPL